MDPVLEGLPEQDPIPGIDEKLQRQAAGSWRDLVNAWTAGDVSGVNGAAVALAGRVREMNPDAYPSVERLSWDNWYFEADQLTRGWLIYMFSIVLLLLGTIYR